MSNKKQTTKEVSGFVEIIRTSKTKIDKTDKTMEVKQTTDISQKKQVKLIKTKKEDVILEKKCGLCGQKKQLIKTECCNEWICDDESKYVMFSYMRNSCYRNHNRYTLCGYHSIEGHGGEWKTCKKCKKEFDTEMYVWYGTNEYNFSKLENPPTYEPTRCSSCNKIIKLPEGGYTVTVNGCYCFNCGKF